ncbi:MAG TPA: DUF1844 domain-containing protein [Terracidiphilus sp.]|jgi:hypothetical protein|nr:DUF1844 domain-containing protein [Terracidiphilus sp.]
MSDTPKFEVIDRRKHKAEEEEREAAQQPAVQQPAPQQPTAEKPAEDASGPRLVTSEPSATETADGEFAGEPPLPPPPSAEESQEQKFAYDASSQRLEDLVRAQNPGMGPQPPVNFEQLVQQFYLSAMIQMGAGTQEGQRPRVDILGARQTIDLLGILAEKTKGNLTPQEDRMLQAVLFEARMAFLELTNMITMQGVQAPPPPAPKR